MIINNFYDDKRFSPQLDSTKSDKIHITQVGAISRIKNQSFSVRVTEELIKMGVDVTLNIIGFDLDVEYKKELIELTHKLGLTDSVTFLPGNCDIPSILRESKIFIMPSLHEGFGIALIEAQAMNLICFASTGIPNSTDCGGVSFLPIESGPKYWAHQIKEAIGKDSILSNTQRYKLSVVIKSYIDLYNKKI